MTKDTFDRIAGGLAAAVDYAEGSADPDQFGVHIPVEVDLKGIRSRLGMSQEGFARAFGFSIGRIRDWEQGRSPIDAPSRVLLLVIDKEPDAVRRALAAAA